MTRLSTEEYASMKSWLKTCSFAPRPFWAGKMKALFAHIDSQQHQIDGLTSDRDELAKMVGTLSDALDTKNKVLPNG